MTVVKVSADKLVSSASSSSRLQDRINLHMSLIVSPLPHSIDNMEFADMRVGAIAVSSDAVLRPKLVSQRCKPSTCEKDDANPLLLE